MANLRTLEAVAIGTAQFAADAAGAVVPGASLAGSAVKGIHESVQQVSIHREKCQSLANKCTKILGVIQEHDGPDAVQNAQFRAALDEVTPTFQKINEKVVKWSHRPFFWLWLQSSSVEDRLNAFVTDLDSALAQLDVHHKIITQKELSGIKMLLEHHSHQLDNMEATISEKRRYMDAALQGDSRAIRHLVSDVAAQAAQVSPTQDGVDSDTSLQSAEVQRKEYEQRKLLLQQLLKHDLPTKVRVLDGEVKVERGDSSIISQSAHAEVRKGTWIGNEVALKSYLRLIKNDADGRVKARFIRELQVWDELFRNEHVVQLYGIVCDIEPSIHIVSAFQRNGDLEARLLRYNKERNEAGAYPPDFDRIKLMRGLAEGLAYLHSCRIVHGKLNCSKVLISDDYEAKLCDFGMSTVLNDLNDPDRLPVTDHTNARYSVPELVHSDQEGSYATDTWQYASCVLHCFSNEVPYHDIKKSLEVAGEVIEGKHPNRPPKEGLSRKWITDDIWDLLVRCWSVEPEKRPLMSDNRQMMIKLERSADTSEVVEP